MSIRRALGNTKYILANGKHERKESSPNPRGERKWEGVRTAAAQDKGRERERDSEGET